MGNQVVLKRKELRSYLSDWFLGFGGNCSFGDDVAPKDVSSSPGCVASPENSHGQSFPLTDLAFLIYER